MKCQLLTSNILQPEISYSLAAGVFHFFEEWSGREGDESPFLTRYFYHSLGHLPLPQELHSFPLPQTFHFSVSSNDEELISYIGHSACWAITQNLSGSPRLAFRLCICSHWVPGATESKPMSNQWLSGLPIQEMLEVSPIFR